MSIYVISKLSIDISLILKNIKISLLLTDISIDRRYWLMDIQINKLSKHFSHLLIIDGASIFSFSIIGNSFFCGGKAKSINNEPYSVFEFSLIIVKYNNNASLVKRMFFIENFFPAKYSMIHSKYDIQSGKFKLPRYAFRWIKYS